MFFLGIYSKLSGLQFFDKVIFSFRFFENAQHSYGYACAFQIAKEKNDFVKFLPLHLISSIKNSCFQKNEVQVGDVFKMK